ncbi:IS481 family transposase [Elusimicrobiota bacterium]
MNQNNNSIPKRLTLKQWQQVQKAHMRQAAIEEWENNPKLGFRVISEIFGIDRSTFWRWRKRLNKQGLEGLMQNRLSGRHCRISPEIEQKIIELRQEKGWGHQRIQLYLKRYLNVNIASSTAWTVFKRHNMPNLYITRYNKPSKRPFKRYQKRFPGETLQMDVKFIKDPKAPFRRFYQFAARDDCTRYRVLRIYSRNTTGNAIDFLKQVKKAFPAVIREVQTDNGPEFATDFTFYLDRQGIHHRLIRPKTPRLNGKVERSFRTDEEEFYSREQFSDIEDIKQKLSGWERYYNHERMHMALDGQTPAEKLESKLSTESTQKIVVSKSD